MQPVLRPPPRRIRLRLQPPRLIILAAGDAPVGMLLLHHPLQATLAFRVQHLPPVQAVRDDYPALSVLKAVVQPLRVDLLRHPTGIIIPVAGQHSDAPGGVIPHASRQTALRGADGLSPRIILYLTAAAVRGNDSGEVSCGAVLITGFTPLRIPLTDQLTARVITAVSADAFFPVNGDLLTVPVILIPRRVPRAVRKRLKLTVPVSRYSPPHPGSVFHRTGQATAGRIIKPARNVTVARGLFRQPSLLIILPAAAKPVRVRHRRHLPLAVIAIPYRPAVRQYH
ncbi:Uncharacterised protein [Shigella sonnei]|nr:Uncharacterised protein [Shigella sonnei]